MHRQKKQPSTNYINLKHIAILFEVTSCLFFYITGSFSAVVWKNTTKLGAGIAWDEVEEGYIIVAFYEPQGWESSKLLEVCSSFLVCCKRVFIFKACVILHIFSSKE